MKLYGFGAAANAQRVQVFLAEKGIEIPLVEVNVREGEQYSEPWASMNPFNCVPFLELDDGTIIAESMTICRYIEELHPEPSLFGRTPGERAQIDMWCRRIELDGFLPMLHAVRNHVPMFSGRVIPGTRSDRPQLPALVQRGTEMMEVFLGRFEPHMADREFVARDRFTAADIIGYFAVRTTGVVGMAIEDRFPAVARWFAACSGRPAFSL